MVLRVQVGHWGAPADEACGQKATSVRLGGGVVAMLEVGHPDAALEGLKGRTGHTRTLESTGREEEKKV